MCRCVSRIRMASVAAKERAAPLFMLSFASNGAPAPETVGPLVIERDAPMNGAARTRRRLAHTTEDEKERERELCFLLSRDTSRASRSRTRAQGGARDALWRQSEASPADLGEAAQRRRQLGLLKTWRSALDS